MNYDGTLGRIYCFGGDHPWVRFPQVPLTTPVALHDLLGFVEQGAHVSLTCAGIRAKRPNTISKLEHIFVESGINVS